MKKEYNHEARIREVFARRVAALSLKDFIKLTEYAGCLLEGRPATLFFHNRETTEFNVPFRPGAIQTQPRHNDSGKNISTMLTHGHDMSGLPKVDRSATQTRRGRGPARGSHA